MSDATIETRVKALEDRQNDLSAKIDDLKNNLMERDILISKLNDELKKEREGGFENLKINSTPVASLPSQDRTAGKQETPSGAKNETFRNLDLSRENRKAGAVIGDLSELSGKEELHQCSIPYPIFIKWLNNNLINNELPPALVIYSCRIENIPDNTVIMDMTKSTFFGFKMDPRIKIIENYFDGNGIYIDDPRLFHRGDKYPDFPYIGDNIYRTTSKQEVYPQDAQDNMPKNLSEIVQDAAIKLSSCNSPSVDIDKRKSGGIPILKGTRFPIARIIAEIADGYSIKEIAKDFNLKKGKIKRFLEGMAVQLDTSLLHLEPQAVFNGTVMGGYQGNRLGLKVYDANLTCFGEGLFNAGFKHWDGVEIIIRKRAEPLNVVKPKLPFKDDLAVCAAMVEQTICAIDSLPPLPPAPKSNPDTIIPHNKERCPYCGEEIILTIGRLLEIINIGGDPHPASGDKPLREYYKSKCQNCGNIITFLFGGDKAIRELTVRL